MALIMVLLLVFAMVSGISIGQMVWDICVGKLVLVLVSMEFVYWYWY